MTWLQNYDPLGNPVFTAIAAALPVGVLYYLMAVRRTAVWHAALAGCVTAAAVAVAIFGMPARMVVGAGAMGLLYGAVRTAWVMLAALFVVRISIDSGQFAILKQWLDAVFPDRGLQALWVAFALGTLLEGAGGGAAVAVTTAILAGLGFPPLQSATLALIGNTVSAAYGGLGNPVRALAASSGLPEADLLVVTVRILAPAALILPFWMLPSIGGVRRIVTLWPGLLASGMAFAAVQVFGARLLGAGAIDLASGTAMIAVLIVFAKRDRTAANALSFGWTVRAWSPFLLLAGFIVIWSLPPVAKTLDSVSWRHAVAGLHLQVASVPPLVAKVRPEPARLEFPWLAASGTAVLFAGLVAARLVGLPFRAALNILFRLVAEFRGALVALALLGAMAFTTRYAGMDAAIGVAISRSGSLFPCFAAAVGWLGAAFSGTAAGSNSLFGTLQVSAARHLGLSPLLMSSANAAGGAMGKMMSAPSLVVASVAAGHAGEGCVFRAAVLQSLGLLLLISILVLLA